MDYHVFREKDKCYLYLPTYKQAFIIKDDEYHVLEQNLPRKNIILKSYSDKLKDSRKQKNSVDNKRYELYLCVSNDCNARCIYCYAQFGNYGKPKGIMTEAVAYDSIDYFFNHISDDALVIVTFFGGEPLMASNIIKKSCMYITNKYTDRKVEFHITTNATLITDDIADLFLKYRFKVVISIDGGATIQNVQRPLVGGTDSFEKIIRIIPELFERRIPVAARGTYVVGNYNLKEAYEDLINLKFERINIVPDFFSIRTDDRLSILMEQLEELYEYIVFYAKYNSNFPFSSFAKRIRQLFLPICNSTDLCNAGKNTFAIDLCGDIYPCQRFSGDVNSKIGNIRNDKKLLIFVPREMDCSKCWNINTCMHRCQHIQNQESKSIQNYYCMYSKKMTEICIRLCTVLTKEQLLSIVRRCD